MFVKIESDLTSIERDWAYDLNFCYGHLRKNVRLTLELLSTSFTFLGRLSFKLEWWLFHRRGHHIHVVFSNNEVLASFPRALIHWFIWGGLSIVFREFIGEQVKLVLPNECLGCRVVDAEHWSCLHKIKFTSLMDICSAMTFLRNWSLAFIGILAYLFLQLFKFLCIEPYKLIIILQNMIIVMNADLKLLLSISIPLGAFFHIIILVSSSLYIYNYPY